MSVYRIHVDTHAAIARPNSWLRPAGQPGTASPAGSPAETSQTAPRGSGPVQDRLWQALQEVPGIRDSVVAAAREELASGRLLTRGAALETATAFLGEIAAEEK